MSFSLSGGRRRKRSHRRKRRGGNVLGAALRKGSVPLTLLALNNYLGKKSRRHGRKSRRGTRKGMARKTARRAYKK